MARPSPPATWCSAWVIDSKLVLTVLYFAARQHRDCHQHGGRLMLTIQRLESIPSALENDAAGSYTLTAVRDRRANLTSLSAPVKSPS